VGPSCNVRQLSRAAAHLAIHAVSLALLSSLLGRTAGPRRAQSGTGADFNVVRWCSTRSPAESAPVPDFKNSDLVAGTLLSAVWIVKQLLEPLAERFGVAIEP
jgi:hypothetical protein